MGADNQEHTPYVIHRALLGSLERFIGILTEHYGGAFPFWLAPVQVRVLPVGEGHRDGAETVALHLREAGYRVDVGEATETIGKRIRDRRAREDPVRRSSTATVSRRNPSPFGAAGATRRPSAL